MQLVKQIKNTARIFVWCYLSYTCIALCSFHAYVEQDVLLVVLCLKKVEFFLYAVTGFANCELKGLPRLWWTLKQRNARTSHGGTPQQSNITPFLLTYKSQRVEALHCYQGSPRHL